MNLSKQALERLFFPWLKYGRKLAARIENPKNGGFFTQEEAETRALRLAIGKEGAVDEGNAVSLFLLVDEEDGIIAEAKFQAFGHTALIGAAEAACELLLRKNYDQARRVTADLLDRQFCEKGEKSSFPEEAAGHLNLVLAAIEMAADQCMDIPIADGYVAPPISQDTLTQGGEYPGWKELTKAQKLTVIESVIASDIRPYIELDAGGVQVLDLIHDHEVIIKYEGSCTTCYSATGSTLSAIQNILQAKVYPDLTVTPSLLPQ